MKKAFLFLAFIFSVSTYLNIAQAGPSSPVRDSEFIQGNWSGWAYWHFQGSNDKCYSNILFAEDTQQITRRQGSVDCEFVGLEMGELTLQKNDQGELLYENEVVGHYSNYTIEWIEAYSPTVNIEVSIELNESKTNMNYVEKWINKDGKEIYIIESRLFKKQQ